MKTTMKALALAAFVTTLAGAAYAADKAMDCCAKCECCKDKDHKPDTTPPSTPPAHH